MEQEIEIDVMIADASHEVYVDTILDTIESAAKVRGTGIAKRTHEYVAQKMKEGKAVIALAGNEFAGFYRVMGKQAVRDYLRLDRTSEFPGLGYRETHQRHDFPTCPHALAESEDIQPYLRRCRDEDEYRAGICTGYVLRLDGR